MKSLSFDELRLHRLEVTKLIPIILSEVDAQVLAEMAWCSAWHCGSSSFAIVMWTDVVVFGRLPMFSIS